MVDFVINNTKLRLIIMLFRIIVLKKHGSSSSIFIWTFLKRFFDWIDRKKNSQKELTKNT